MAITEGSIVQSFAGKKILTSFELKKQKEDIQGRFSSAALRKQRKAPYANTKTIVPFVVNSTPSKKSDANPEVLPAAIHKEVQEIMREATFVSQVFDLGFDLLESLEENIRKARFHINQKGYLSAIGALFQKAKKTAGYNPFKIGNFKSFSTSLFNKLNGFRKALIGNFSADQQMLVADSVLIAGGLPLINPLEFPGNATAGVDHLFNSTLELPATVYTLFKSNVSFSVRKNSSRKKHKGYSNFLSYNNWMKFLFFLNFSLQLRQTHSAAIHNVTFIENYTDCRNISGDSIYQNYPPDGQCQELYAYLNNTLLFFSIVYPVKGYLDFKGHYVKGQTLDICKDAAHTCAGFPQVVTRFQTVLNHQNATKFITLPNATCALQIVQGKRCFARLNVGGLDPEGCQVIYDANPASITQNIISYCIANEEYEDEKESDNKCHQFILFVGAVASLFLCFMGIKKKQQEWEENRKNAEFLNTTVQEDQPVAKQPSAPGLSEQSGDVQSAAAAGAVVGGGAVVGNEAIVAGTGIVEAKIVQEQNGAANNPGNSNTPSIVNPVSTNVAAIKGNIVAKEDDLSHQSLNLSDDSPTSSGILRFSTSSKSAFRSLNSSLTSASAPLLAADSKSSDEVSDGKEPGQDDNNDKTAQRPRKKKPGKAHGDYVELVSMD